MHLINNEELIEAYKTKLSIPTYYQTNFSAKEIDTIQEETEATAKQLGY